MSSINTLDPFGSILRPSRRSSSYGGQAGRLLLSLAKGQDEFREWRPLHSVFAYQLRRTGQLLACPPKLTKPEGLDKSRLGLSRRTEERYGFKRDVLLILLLLLSTKIYSEFRLGIENISDKFTSHYLDKKISIGLVTNQTGADQKGNRTVDILKEKGFEITVIFAPEHGFEGNSKAEQEIKDGFDAKSGIPIISLYGKGFGKKINPEMIKNIDAFFFDIQDSGIRHYTYISTLFRILQTAAQEGKQIVVFDRPNPLGKTMEGPLVEPSLISFISIAPIPLRHGMTVGELAEYFNNYVLEKKAQLTVISMNEYDRSYGLADLHAPLSPNIASKESCHGYCFLGLLGEVSPFDVAIGTAHAFQVVTLPESLQVSQSTWKQLATQLKIHGIHCSSYKFYSERKKEMHVGLKLSMPNINHVNAFNAFLTIVATMKKAGVSISFKPIFDKAAGSKQVRLFLMGNMSYQELINEISSGLQSFFQKAQSVFKYFPHPELII
jgi:uncharacterized protein YbbC (DUF1343 family)